MSETWEDHDWSVPTDLNTLRHRPYPTVDQSRYGHATTDPPRYGPDGRPLPIDKQARQRRKDDDT